MANRNKGAAPKEKWAYCGYVEFYGNFFIWEKDKTNIIAFCNKSEEAMKIVVALSFLAKSKKKPTPKPRKAP